MIENPFDLFLAYTVVGDLMEQAIRRRMGRCFWPWHRIRVEWRVMPWRIRLVAPGWTGWKRTDLIEVDYSARWESVEAIREWLQEGKKGDDSSERETAALR